MIALPKLNAEIISCMRCPRLVTHREAVAQNKRRQYRDALIGESQFLALEIRMPDYISWALPQLRTAEIEPDGSLPGTEVEIGFTKALYRFGFANQATSTHENDGLRLADCYIGATVRCAPPANKPTLEEFTACRQFVLGELRELKRVRVVVTLGKIAFDQYLKAIRELGDERPNPRSPIWSWGNVCIALGI